VVAIFDKGGQAARVGETHQFYFIFNQCGSRDSTMGVLGGGGHWNLARDGGWFHSSFSDGASSWWWTSGNGTTPGGGSGVGSLLMPSGPRRLEQLQMTRQR
jgi:hypothetical protein